MAKPATYIDVSYASAQEFWDEIVLASAGRLKSDPTRAHAMACAIYLTHFLDWVFHEKHPRDDTAGNTVYVAFKQRHQAACPELGWLAELSDVAKHRGVGRQVRLKKLKGSSVWRKGTITDELGTHPHLSKNPLILELVNGTQHHFDEVVEKAINYWKAHIGS
jgi:hypothetical protein